MNGHPLKSQARLCTQPVFICKSEFSLRMIASVNADRKTTSLLLELSSDSRVSPATIPRYESDVRRELSRVHPRFEDLEVQESIPASQQRIIDDETGCWAIIVPTSVVEARAEMNKERNKLQKAIQDFCTFFERRIQIQYLSTRQEKKWRGFYRDPHVAWFPVYAD